MESFCLIMDNMTTVINSQFCSPDHVHLTIIRKPIFIKNCNFLVADQNGNHLFKVKQKFWSVHHRLVLLEYSNSNPIASFKKKTLSVHKRWQVFQGDSSKTGDLLFSTRNSSLVGFKVELDVFLAGDDKEERSWDFKVVGNWSERSCIVYNKESKPIAQMEKKHAFGRSVFGKENLNVTVYPQVDYGFIVALVLILCEINGDMED